MKNNERQQTTGMKDLSFPVAKAYLYAFLFFIPLLLMLEIYWIIWGEPYAVLDATLSNIFILGFILISGIVLHEVIHGLAWITFSNKSFNTIKFGFQWKTFTPYAHSRAPLEVRAYRLGIMMPGLVLGVLPYLVGVITGNAWILFFGLFFTWSASGDALVLWSIRKVKPGQLVEDHPTRCGFYVIEPSYDKNLTAA